MTSAHNRRPAEGRGYRPPAPPVDGQEYWRIGTSLVILPFAAVLFSFPYFIHYASAYSRGVAAALGIGTDKQARHPQAPPDAGRPGQEPAWTQFLFGPVWLDVRHVVTVGLQRQWDYTSNEFTQIRQKYFNRGTDTADYSFAGRSAPHELIDGSGRIMAMTMAAVLVGLLLLISTAVQAVAIAVIWALSLMAVYLLRGLDTIRLRIHSIRITCGTPGCYGSVAYPSYKCPADATLHRDVRPGRYGVIKRHCKCGRAFPTLLMLGSYKLQAYCPNCHQELLPDAGRHREIVLPIFGLSNAGKTQLLVAVAATVKEMLEREKGSAEPADDYTHRWFEEAVSKESLSNGPSKTLKMAQRPYSFRLSGSTGEIVVRMFDAAGEIFSAADRVRELHYMRAGKTFLFVIDPWTIPEFCPLLPSDQRPADPDPAQRKRVPVQVLAEVVQNMHAKNVNMKSVRLHVVISKADLIEQQIVEAGIDDSNSIRDWFAGPVDEGGLDQANLYLTAKTEFKEVYFSLTNAKYKGGFDSSIERFIETILAGEGYKI